MPTPSVALSPCWVILTVTPGKNCSISALSSKSQELKGLDEVDDDVTALFSDEEAFSFSEDEQAERAKTRMANIGMIGKYNLSGMKFSPLI